MRISRKRSSLVLLVAAILAVQPLLLALSPAASAHAQVAAIPAPSGRGQVVLDGPMGTHVNTFNGNLYYSRTDMDLPGCGMGLELTFAY